MLHDSKKCSKQKKTFEKVSLISLKTRVLHLVISKLEIIIYMKKSKSY